MSYTGVMHQDDTAARIIEVALPAAAFAHHPWDPARVAHDMRLLWLIEQVRDRRLGAGKAASIAGLPRAAFLLEMGKHGVSCFDYDPGELEAEVAALG